MAIDYAKYRKTAGNIGFRRGFAEESTRRRNALNERFQTMSKDTAAADRMRAKEQLKTQLAEATKEDETIENMRSAGELVQDEETGKLKYDTPYFRRLAREQAGIKGDSSQEALAFQLDEKTLEQMRSKHGQYYNRRYKPVDQIQRDMGDFINTINEAESINVGRQQVTGLDNLMTLGLAKSGEFAQPTGTMPSGMVDEGGKDYTVFPEAPAYTAPVSTENIKASDLKPMHARDLEGKDMEGTFWLNPVDNTVSGPGTRGFIDADSFSLIPTERHVFTGKFTDENTGEEMQGDLIQTWAHDRDRVTSIAGVAYAPLGTPVSLRGKRDQHTPKGSSLDTTQLKDIDRRNLATRMQHLTQSMADLNYTSNPIRWIESNISTFQDVFQAAVGLDTGASSTETLSRIADYINSGLTDEDAAAGFSRVDVAAIEQGAENATSTLLAYTAALWLNGGTRITQVVRESAAEMVGSSDIFSGTLGHKGKIGAAQAEATNERNLIVSRHLRQARDDDAIALRKEYPTVARYRKEGYEYITDKLEGMQMQKKLDRLEETDPEAYEASMDSLATTAINYEGMGKRPIFWEETVGVNLMLYYKVDPVTKAYIFETKRVD